MTQLDNYWLEIKEIPGLVPRPSQENPYRPHDPLARGVAANWGIANSNSSTAGSSQDIALVSNEGLYIKRSTWIRYGSTKDMDFDKYTDSSGKVIIIVKKTLTEEIIISYVCLEDGFPD